jgi:ATP adenylyltransferase
MTTRIQARSSNVRRGSSKSAARKSTGKNKSRPTSAPSSKRELKAKGAKSEMVGEHFAASDKGWPNEREILWRPNRFTYLSKREEPSACVFCAALDSGINAESLVLFESDFTMVMLNKYPYNNGHLLVLPTRHVADIEDLSDNEYSDLNNQVRKAISALRKAYDKAPHGVNAGLNLGAAAGAGIPQHLHFHIIPRWFGDSNFFPLIGQAKVISETLEQTYQRLLPYFK